MRQAQVSLNAGSFAGHLHEDHAVGVADGREHREIHHDVRGLRQIAAAASARLPPSSRARRRVHGALAPADGAARVVEQLGPVGELLLVRRLMLTLESCSGRLARVDDALAAGRLVRVRRHGARAEEAREAVEDLRRRPVARKDLLGLVDTRSPLGVAGAAADAADLHEERRATAGVDLLGGDVIQRATGRLGVELPDVLARCRRWGSPGSSEERATNLRVGVVLLPVGPLEAPLVHGADAARHQELVRVRRQRRERRHRHVVGGVSGAVGLRREPPVRQAPVVREEHDQPLRSGDAVIRLRLRLTLRDGAAGTVRRRPLPQATENQSAIECRLRLFMV